VRGILRARAVLLERRAEGIAALAVCLRVGEERHGGAEFQIVGVAEDLLQRASGERIHQLRALAQARPEQWMRQIGTRLTERADRVRARGGAVAQALELRKDEPHPVAAFLTGRELLAHAGMNGLWARSKRSRS
jgi:hypothetical protein